jgi:N-formylmaleamate deformylase
MVTPAHWKEQYADVGDVRIRYHRTGGNKPQIVLLHGITDNGLCWTPVAKELEASKQWRMMGLSSSGYSA